MKTISFTAAAAKQLDALPPDIRGQIENALDRYAVNGIGDVRRLSGRDSFRMRIGRYRVLFDEDEQTILSIYVGVRETTTYGRH